LKQWHEFQTQSSFPTGTYFRASDFIPGQRSFPLLQEATLIFKTEGDNLLRKKLILLTAVAGLILLVGAAISQGGREMTTPSGLKVEFLQEGKGPLPQKGQKVVVHYTGTLADGKKFDSSRDRGEPFTFTLGMGQVIKGWDEGLALMNVGSRAKLTIPAALGYGAGGAGNVIPPNAVLNFDVELLDAK
jgi:peptidylprolyl isomerase